jgi:hypothetical protein
MRYNITIQIRAKEEFFDAMRWYEMQRKGLGDELELCFEETLEILRRNPLYEIRHNNVRILNIRRFPYQVVYTVEGNQIDVISFYHAHRDPENWKNLK